MSLNKYLVSIGYISLNILLLLASILYLKTFFSLVTPISICLYLLITISLAQYLQYINFRKILISYPLVLIITLLPTIYVSPKLDPLHNIWFAIIHLIILAFNITIINYDFFKITKNTYNKYYIIISSTIIVICTLNYIPHIINYDYKLLLFIIITLPILFIRQHHLKNDIYARSEPNADIIIPAIYFMIMTLMIIGQLFIIFSLDKIIPTYGVIAYEILIVITYILFFATSYDHPLRFTLLTILTLLLYYIPKTYIHYDIEPTNLVFFTIFFIIFTLSPQVIYSKDTLLSEIKIIYDRIYNMYVLMNNDIIHGTQYCDDDKSNHHISYMSKHGPLGDIYNIINKQKITNTAVIGLGAGMMAAYNKEHQNMIFYEINDEIIKLNKEGKYFTYIKNALGKILIKSGDAMDNIQKEVNKYFDVLIIDAYTGVEIPKYIVNKNAINLFKTKLQENGILIFHVSGQYTEEQQEIINILIQANFKTLFKKYTPSDEEIDYVNDVDENLNKNNNQTDFITNIKKHDKTLYSNEIFEILKRIWYKSQPLLINAIEIFVDKNRYKPFIDPNSKWIIATNNEEIITNLVKNYNWQQAKYKIITEQ